MHHLPPNGRRWDEVLDRDLSAGSPTPPLDLLENCSELAGTAEGYLSSELIDALIPQLAAATSSGGDCSYALWSGFGWLRPGGLGVWFSDASQAEVEQYKRQMQQAVDEAYADVVAFADRCPVCHWWGGRDYLLFDGPLEAVTTIGSPEWRNGPPYPVDRAGPQWWWPRDRAWFASTEIDDSWTYIAGSHDLIGNLHGSGLDTVVVSRNDPW